MIETSDAMNVTPSRFFLLPGMGVGGPGRPTVLIDL
jgi:hypothetical protein